jgi:hypothetical protein
MHITQFENSESSQKTPAPTSLQSPGFCVCFRYQILFDFLEVWDKSSLLLPDLISFMFPVLQNFRSDGKPDTPNSSRRLWRSKSFPPARKKMSSQRVSRTITNKPLYGNKHLLAQSATFEILAIRTMSGIVGFPYRRMDNQTLPKKIRTCLKNHPSQGTWTCYFGW